MLATINSLGAKGIGGYAVTVESFVSNELFNFDIVGLPDAASGMRFFIELKRILLYNVK